MPALSPSRTARGIGTTCPWRRSSARRWVTCQSLHPQWFMAVRSRFRWSVEKPVRSGHGEGADHLLALRAVVAVEGGAVPGHVVAGVRNELRVRVVADPGVADRGQRRLDR